MNLSLIDKKTAATLLGVSVVTVDRLRKDGSLPYRQIGGLIRFTPEDISNCVNNSLTNGLQRRSEVQNETTA